MRKNMMQEITQIKKSNSRKEIRRIAVVVNLIVFGLIMAPMVAFAQPANDDFDYGYSCSTHRKGKIRIFQALEAVQ
jgi:hypothetical protein